jgi:hypothetical protein
MVDDQTTLLFPSAGQTTLPLCAPHELLCCTAAGPGGHALRVLLDTGTDPSAIDAGLARRLALRTGGSGLGQGAASDEVPFTEAVLPWLRLGDLTIRDLFAPALDLSGLPFQIDVVLGYNVLRQLTLQIDYRRRLLTLAHPDLDALAVGGVALPLTFFEHFPALRDISIAGRAIALATLDTGSNAALTIGPDIASELGLRSGHDGVWLASGAGFGGGADVLRGNRQALRLGPFELDDVELDAPHVLHGDLSRTGRANIGNRLLARFAAIGLDYERQLFTLELHETSVSSKL